MNCFMSTVACPLYCKIMVYVLIIVGNCITQMRFEMILTFHFQVAESDFH